MVCFPVCLVSQELNISELHLTSDEGKFVHIRAEPDRAKLGKRLRKDAATVTKAITELPVEKIKAFQTSGKMTIGSYEIAADEVQVGATP